MTDARPSDAILQGIRLAAALPVVLLGIFLLKLVGIAEEIHPLRKYLVSKNVIGYSAPQDDAICECPECDYVGVLKVDKHRRAPMSKDNWGLFCPGCGHELEGPIYADRVGEYINQSRDSDHMGSMMEIGGYAAFKTADGHNRRHALPLSKIEELREVDGGV